MTSKQTLPPDLIVGAPTGADVVKSRLKHGFTQTEMAAALGAGRYDYIGAIERGERNMPPLTWSAWLLMCGEHPQFDLVPKSVPRGN